MAFWVVSCPILKCARWVQAGRAQTDVAEALGTTQQHFSQIDQGQRSLSLEQRRRIVTELDIAAEDLGLSSGCARA
ncbi:MAG: helix-turn-helix transcriptional regulator [Pseudonocardiaceae bacterium]